MFLVLTPGHMTGHVSVVVGDDAMIYFFAGDTTYSDLLLNWGKRAREDREQKAAKAINGPRL
jgi:glyoxylase-like metal-dependent hydrolase (beta-lactamase superfamily II)